MLIMRLLKGTINHRAIIGNPFYLFAIVLLLTFSLYLLGWSSLFPQLHFNFLLFVISILLVFIFIGFVVRKRITGITEIGEDKPSFRILLIGTVLILLVFIAEFIYNRRIPLFDILFSSTASDYRKYIGLPYFHSVAISFGFFVIAILYSLFLETKKWKYLLLIGVNLVPHFLLFSRSTIVIALIQCFLYTALKIKRTSLVNVLLGICFMLLAAYAFGVAGNYRETGKDRGTSNPDFEMVSKINENYPKVLPLEFAWAYMYSASPIANLQHNIIKSSPVSPNFKGLLVSEFMPARAKFTFAKMFKIKERGPAQISKSFTVGTTFTGSFSYAGWWGVALMSLVLMAIIAVVTYFIAYSSPYSLITLSTLCVFTVLSFFDNMISFTPMFLFVFISLAFHLIYLKSKARV